MKTHVQAAYHFLSITLTFTNLKPSLYTVYAQDKLGCGLIQKEVWLLYYPHFFTPNNDTYNDTWSILNSEYEPDLKVYI